LQQSFLGADHVLSISTFVEWNDPISNLKIPNIGADLPNLPACFMAKRAFGKWAMLVFVQVRAADSTVLHLDLDFAWTWLGLFHLCHPNIPNAMINCCFHNSSFPFYKEENMHFQHGDYQKGEGDVNVVSEFLNDGDLKERNVPS
jgi:hypothetical protein